ncbi:hypothetical protein [Streptosporangium amethystogenes]|uniref:hypothetical protein n=1 Tax=Streptosporangium amethystogenes TaxID=2002 RepID=UPI00068FE62E|nr:hypothetical protein [Streptosporangium amethystogenes]
MNQQWSTVSDNGLTRPVVLAVDFDATGRREATFYDLVQLFPGPLTVWLSAQPPKGYDESLSPDEYLAWWAGDSLGASVRVGAVLGYCAGSLFASALADEIERRQAFRPRVVLFNPGKPNATTLNRDFDGTIRSMALLTSEERSAFLEKARIRLDAPFASFDDACEVVLDLYGQASRVTFSRAGIDLDVGEELLGVFRSYASYLRAAHQVEYRPEWAEAAAVLSREHPGEPAFTRTHIRSEVGREHLLGDPGVARTAFRLIESEA